MYVVMATPEMQMKVETKGLETRVQALEKALESGKTVG